MRFRAIFITALILIAIGGGCSKTYYGKFVTAKVKSMPMDEFKTGNFAVLAFENKKDIAAEGWKWEFRAYRNTELETTFKLVSKIVANQRSYYLIENIPGSRPETIAHFPAFPNYERVKDRLEANLSERK